VLIYIFVTYRYQFNLGVSFGQVVFCNLKVSKYFSHNSYIQCRMQGIAFLFVAQ
jgi:hypothetical protein